MVLSRAKSVTHQHLLSIINTCLQMRDPDDEISTFSILDVGCGQGEFLLYIKKCLESLAPDINIHLVGFDIHEHAGFQKSYLNSVVTRLEEKCPDYPWRDSISVISSSESWPYNSESFDLVCSNQVLEHVHDIDHVFSETYRVLRWGGKAVHLFPVEESLYEGHLNLPFAHKFKNWLHLRSYIYWLNAFGLGRFKEHRTKNVSLSDYADSRADYMLHYTHYRKSRIFKEIGKNYGFRTSFRFTPQFYSSKLAAVLKVKPRYIYAKTINSWLESILVIFLKRISSITLYLEKEDRFKRRPHDSMPTSSDNSSEAKKKHR